MLLSFKTNNKSALFNNGALFIENQYIGDFIGVKEAKEYCLGLQLSEELDVLIENKEVLDSDISIVLKESTKYKVTNELVECFKQLIETKMFYPSNELISLRENQSSHVGKIDYTLKDGSTVLIDINTNKEINEHIDTDLLGYMTESSEKFVSTVRNILEANNG